MTMINYDNDMTMIIIWYDYDNDNDMTMIWLWFDFDNDNVMTTVDGEETYRIA